MASANGSDAAAPQARGPCAARDRERVDAAIQLTIDGIAAGLRNTG